MVATENCLNIAITKRPIRCCGVAQVAPATQNGVVGDEEARDERVTKLFVLRKQIMQIAILIIIVIPEVLRHRKQNQKHRVKPNKKTKFNIAFLHVGSIIPTACGGRYENFFTHLRGTVTLNKSLFFVF